MTTPIVIYDARESQRFWSKVAICVHGRQCSACCWLWQGCTNKQGYGFFVLHCPPRPQRGKMVRAHRYAYTWAYGMFIPTLDVLHTCDIPACVNPAHLWLGTNQENVRDCIQKQRHTRGEMHGSHKLTTEYVQGIRALAAQGMPLQLIADRYQVDRETIRAIVKRRQWKHVE